MDTTRLVIIRSFSNEVDAEIARQHLATNGVDAYVRTDDCGGMYPWRQEMRGVFLEVLDSDKENAEKILAAMGS
jgi:hypothetical protein